MLAKYLFYKLYRFIKLVDADSIPEWTTSFLVVALEVFNLAVLLELINMYLFPIQIERFADSKIILFIIYLILFAPNYYYFIKDKKYVTIEKLFINESKKSRILGNVALFVYISISLLLFLIVWVK